MKVHASKPLIAILASGSGSTAEAFIEAAQSGRVAAEIGLVVCNNTPQNARIYDRVADLNERHGLDIEVTHISGRTHPQGNVGRGQTLSESEAICDRIQEGGFAHVALMGYMKMLRGALLDEYGEQPFHKSIYQARMSNTHPGSLPETTDTFGMQPSELAVGGGWKVLRHTVHLVSADVDGGTLLAEHPVHVLENDTPQRLFDRVQAVEKAALPYVVGNFLRQQGEYYANS
jgi:phosphoribosylglycinamide formyltransferase-1